ncbi:hypothetical protein C8F04DRAFT_1190525 [Mycena alexandri]|uniref:Uncharacterized protein n=1 Tax=Mycena alexandri TaxID=1745969 RepID=A0AAD6SF32_9AGAR|nr:hypothetical protein C8F04DRAFT_1190525 [Mycena alexandri]
MFLPTGTRCSPQNISTMDDPTIYERTDGEVEYGFGLWVLDSLTPVFGHMGSSPPAIRLNNWLSSASLHVSVDDSGGPHFPPLCGRGCIIASMAPLARVEMCCVSHASAGRCGSPTRARTHAHVRYWHAAAQALLHASLSLPICDDVAPGSFALRLALELWPEGHSGRRPGCGGGWASVWASVRHPFWRRYPPAPVYAQRRAQPSAPWTPPVPVRRGRWRGYAPCSCEGIAPALLDRFKCKYATPGLCTPHETRMDSFANFRGIFVPIVADDDQTL